MDKECPRAAEPPRKGVHLMSSTRVLWLCGLITAAGTASCAEAPKEEVKPISTGLMTLEAEVPPTSGGVDRETQARLDLMAQAQQNSNVSVDGPPTRTPRNRPAAGEPPLVESPPADAQPTTVEPIADAPLAPAPPQAASKESLVAELGAQLRDQARTSSAPAAALLRLASLELLESKAGDADPADRKSVV